MTRINRICGSNTGERISALCKFVSAILGWIPRYVDYPKYYKFTSFSREIWSCDHHNKSERTENFLLEKETKARLKKKRRRNNLKVFPLVGKGEYIPVPLPETFRFSFSHDLHFYSTFECEGNRQRSVADGLSAKCVSMWTREKIAMM